MVPVASIPKEAGFTSLVMDQPPAVVDLFCCFQGGNLDEKVYSFVSHLTSHVPCRL
jgi:hypothetical protein